MLTTESQIKGGIYGLLVGDALGVPCEFHRPEEIPPAEKIEFRPPAGFRRAHAGVEPGTWSDDGAQALCLLASLLECGRLDVEDLARRLVDWQQAGYMAVDGHVYDVGVTTSQALWAIHEGAPVLEASGTDERSNGNGSLMRVLPLALWHRGEDAELVHDAQRQSRITHGHRRAQVCCAFYCLWARRILQMAADPWSEAASTLRTRFADDPEAVEQLEWHIRPDDAPSGAGTGYVVDCLRSARWALQEDSYEKVVRAAIRLGRDTDTTACVAGGLAGLRHGIESIPERWLTNLRGKELVDPLVEKLVGLCPTR